MYENLHDNSIYISNACFKGKPGVLKHCSGLPMVNPGGPLKHSICMQLPWMTRGKLNTGWNILEYIHIYLSKMLRKPDQRQENIVFT